MEKLKLLLIFLSVLFLFRMTESFVNFIQLNGFNDVWGDHDNVRDFNPKKTSDLLAFCDEKRNHCISY